MGLPPHLSFLGQDPSRSFSSSSFPNPGPNPNQTYLDLFAQAPGNLIPAFHNEQEVAHANTFLFNLLVGAMSVNGQGAAYSSQPQHQTEEKTKPGEGPSAFNPALLAELGLTGMPGFDPGMLNADIQLQQQIENHRIQVSVRS